MKFVKVVKSAFYSDITEQEMKTEIDKTWSYVKEGTLPLMTFMEFIVQLKPYLDKIEKSKMKDALKLGE